MTYDPSNIFAKILRGEIPCHKVYEDDATLVFMDVMPQAPGHALVVPKAASRICSTPARRFWSGWLWSFRKSRSPRKPPLPPMASKSSNTMKQLAGNRSSICIFMSSRATRAPDFAPIAARWKSRTCLPPMPKNFALLLRTSRTQQRITP